MVQRNSGRYDRELRCKTEGNRIMAPMDIATPLAFRADQFPVYKKRFLRSLGVWAPQGWFIKCYMTSVYDDKLPPEFVDAGKKFIAQRLPQVDSPHRVGFMILSQGVPRNWVMLDWWQGVLLYENIFVSDENPPRDFGNAPAGLFQCVWELRITQHEREAWLKHVLNNPKGPDLVAYLSDQIDIDV